jgi:alginate O-acetyltransferase complex protein AlgI
MIFNTYWFVIFAAAFFPVYWLLRWPVARGAWLLGSCVIFHFHFAGPAGVLPIIVLGTVTFFCALSRHRWLCVFAITLCAGALIGYKYVYFLCNDLVGVWNADWAKAGAKAAHKLLPIAPPLAISFFTFEFVHYLVEVHRGHPPMRRPGQFALFSIYFPSLVAGPIKRYEQFNPSLQGGLTAISVTDVAAGAQRIGIGMIKKIVIADNLTLALRHSEDRLGDLSRGDTWLLLVGLGARILFDFSGYSDIAIGLARMMGVRLPENFRWPYLAVNLRDFWSRWHISLSTWIRDYIYIPLGGNRHGPARRIANGALAFALCGAWHGASWHFVLWGLWHGAGLAISSSYSTLLGPVGAKLAVLFAKAPPLGWLVTLLFVGFGWLLFFYEPARAWSIALKLVALR